MKRKLFILIALMGIGVIFSSCAKFPQAQFDSTTAAVQITKEAGADVYVPQVYQALVDSLKSATIKAEIVKSKWFFPSYKEVNTLLIAPGVVEPNPPFACGNNPETSALARSIAIDVKIPLASECTIPVVIVVSITPVKRATLNVFVEESFFK